ncbi:histone H4 transcription factor-like [Pholidichthys leucotaenia]
MPPNKRIQKSLKFACEWGSCQDSFDRMESFSKHAEDHLVALKAEEEDEAEAGRNCLWRDCGFCSMEGLDELRQHLFFHCYHTKLKQLGQQMLHGQPELGTCSIACHNRNIIPEIPDNFVCLWEDCEQAPYENPEWFYRHVEMHSLCMDMPTGDAESPRRCGWKDCEATAKGRPQLREHLRSHTQEKVVACPGCGGMYASNTKLFDHIRRQNAMEVSYNKCPSCDMTCPSPSSLRNHIEFLHSNETPYSCDFCEHRCKNLADLHKHLDSHSSESAFHCEVPGCGFTVPTACTMKFHHKKEHEDIKEELQVSADDSHSCSPPGFCA